MGRRNPVYSLDELEALRDEAARESYARIDEDIACASWRIREHLQKIRRELYDSGLDVKRILAACPGDRDAVTVELHRATGESIWEYVENERVATGARMLCHTDANLDDVADLLGFYDRSHFSNVFLRCTGMRPTEFRSGWNDVVERVGRPNLEVVSLRLLKQLREESLSGADARRLLEFFSSLHGTAGAADAHAPDEDTLAREVWTMMEDRPPTEQVSWMRDVVRLDSAALFHLLGERIHDASRTPPESGEDALEVFHLVLLAMIHVESNARELGEKALALRSTALGWLEQTRHWAEGVPGPRRPINARSAGVLRRMEACLLLGLGEEEQAERLLRQARADFHRGRWSRQAALAAMDLTVVLARRGHAGSNAEIPLLASQAIPVLREAARDTSGRRRFPEGESPTDVLEELTEALREDRLAPQLLEKARLTVERLCSSALSPPP